MVDMRDVRRSVLSVSARTDGEDADFDEFATASLVAAFNRLAPNDMALTPRTD